MGKELSLLERDGEEEERVGSQDKVAGYWNGMTSTELWHTLYLYSAKGDREGRPYCAEHQFTPTLVKLLLHLTLETITQLGFFQQQSDMSYTVSPIIITYSNHLKSREKEIRLQVELQPVVD